MSRAATFSEELRQGVDDLWQAQLDHPFVRQMGDGTLPLPALRRWVRQDYRFLIEYCRLLALGAARAPDLETLDRFADLLQSTARTEMSLHRAYAQEFGISEVQLEAEPMHPVNRGYTNFLLRAAATGDFAELVAALLPCMWGYATIGRSLAGRLPGDRRMARWIEMYSDPEFGALAEWCRQLVDKVAEDAGPAARERMRAAFAVSTEYELAFLDMAWEGRTDE